MRCRQCGAENSDQAKFCTKCGNKLPTTIICPGCGAENASTGKFCRNCGRPLECLESPTEKPKKYRKKMIVFGLIAVVLAAAVFIVNQKKNRSLIEQKELEPAWEEDRNVRRERKEREKFNDTDPNPTEEPEEGDAPASYVPSDSIQREANESKAGERETAASETAANETAASESLEAIDIGAEIKEIRDLYYGIQNNLDQYQKEDGGSDTIRYLDQDGNIVKITAKKGAYTSFRPSEIYAAEYFYEISDQKYCPRFVFIYGNNEEYRIYLTKNGDCVRYIDAVGEVHNYQKPISQTELAQITELQGFCTNAVMEIEWAFEGKE